MGSRSRVVTGVGAKQWLVILTLTVCLMPSLSSAGKKKTKTTDRCGTCDGFVKKFGDGLVRTKGQSSGSGNTEWEESRGIKYDTSEARLYEVLDTACSKSDMKCSELMESNEEWIEDWWRSDARSEDITALRKALCVEHTKQCCDEGFYGKTCKACPGDAAGVCSGHGKCGGSGTRGGKGSCKCDSGYIGKRCAKCANLFFKQVQERSSLGFSCEKCDDACAKSCTGPGRSACEKCDAGFEMGSLKDDSGETPGCVDVDECALGTAECAAGKYCVNTDGNYTCAECHKACHPDDGCTGPGPDTCAENSCADGFVFDAESSACTDIDECALDDASDAKPACSSGEFCVNKAGGYDCRKCHAACVDDEGCSGPSPQHCNACAQGWKVPDDRERGCADVDECSTTPCEGVGMTCTNTQGSYECSCAAPWKMVEGKCILDGAVPKDAEALSDANASITKDEL